MTFMGEAMMTPPTAAPPMMSSSTGWNSTARLPCSSRKPPMTQAMTMDALDDREHGKSVLPPFLAKDLPLPLEDEPADFIPDFVVHGDELQADLVAVAVRSAATTSP